MLIFAWQSQAQVVLLRTPQSCFKLRSKFKFPAKTVGTRLLILSRTASTSLKLLEPQLTIPEGKLKAKAEQHCLKSELGPSQDAVEQEGHEALRRKFAGPPRPLLSRFARLSNSSLQSSAADERTWLLS